MWQRFTERARKVVFYAQEEAQGLGEGYVSTEHLLLGLVRESDCVAAIVLEKLGIAPSEVREEVLRHLPKDGARSSQDMSLTPRAKRVIDLAYDEARDLQNNFIGTEHLLLGLIREGDGLAGRVLAKLGAEPDRTRRCVMTIQDQSDPGAGPGALKQKRGWRKWRELLAPAQDEQASDPWQINLALHGKGVRLEPLGIHHAAELFAACDKHMFDYFPIYPATLDLEGMVRYIALRNRARACRAFAVIELNNGRPIGSSSMFDISPEHKTLEIGHTWIKEEFRGTMVNPEMKLLMLRHAFEVLGCNRVQLKTDARNLQSQAAILKLGAKYEGTMRNNMVMPNGHVRTTVYYSIIAEEWPDVKAGLLKRLGRSE